MELKERKAVQKETPQNNMMKYMANPKAFTLKKWFYDLLKLNYSNHDQIIERVSTSLVTEKDVEDFGKLIGQVYEIGYRKAVDDYRKQLEDMGLKIQIVVPETK
jgi:hypothetical protein